MAVENFSNQYQAVNAALYNVTAIEIPGVSASVDNFIFCVPNHAIQGIKGITIDSVVLVSDTGTSGSRVCILQRRDRPVTIAQRTCRQADERIASHS